MARKLKAEKNPGWTFPMLIEATHIDTGYNRAVLRDEQGNYSLGKTGEIVTVKNESDMLAELKVMEYLYGDKFLFEPIPIQQFPLPQLRIAA